MDDSLALVSHSKVVEAKRLDVLFKGNDLEPRVGPATRSHQLLPTRNPLAATGTHSLMKLDESL